MRATGGNELQSQRSAWRRGSWLLAMADAHSHWRSPSPAPPPRERQQHGHLPESVRPVHYSNNVFTAGSIDLVVTTNDAADEAPSSPTIFPIR